MKRAFFKVHKGSPFYRHDVVVPFLVGDSLFQIQASKNLGRDVANLRLSEESLAANLFSRRIELPIKRVLK